jgi:hypothetical protein
MHTETATVLQPLSTSDAETAMNSRTEEGAESGNSQAQEVVKAAGEDLRQLLRKRDEIVKQIRTMKQTIVGVARLFGDDWLSQELWELVGRKGRPRQSGLTKSCRTVLMRLTARWVLLKYANRLGELSRWYLQTTKALLLQLQQC